MQSVDKINAGTIKKIKLMPLLLSSGEVMND
jgi:cobalamin biosynthesis Co2+ chelatase CbiK